MKGLFLKDLYNLRIYSRTLAMLVVFMGVFGVIMKNPTYVCMMVIFMTISVAITAISQDEQAHWEQYALTLPVSKKILVREKMILSYIVVFIGGILSAIVGGIMASSIGESVPMLMKVIVMAVLFVIVVLSILIPAIFKFGADKARFMMMACIAAPIVIVVLIFTQMEKMGIAITDRLISGVLENAIIGGIIVAAIAIFISYKVAIRIYEAKEW